MKTNDCLKMRTVMGQAVIVDEGMLCKGFDKIVVLNKPAAMLWAKFEGRHFQCSDVADALVAHYGIDRARAMADAAVLIDKWKANGLVDD